jgi:hypothetical protein
MSNTLLETREVGELDNQVVSILHLFEMPKTKLDLRGSSQYKHLNYKSDYDLIVALKRNIPASQFYLDLVNILHRIHKNKNAYFIELKLELKNGEKKRLSPGKELRMSWLEKDYDQLDFAKIDTVICLDNKFYEASCIYKFRDQPVEKSEILNDLQADVKEFEKEKNYYKVLKRLFSIYVIENNQNKIHYLTQVFNSNLGKQYEKVSNLKALALLYENYKSKAILSKINKNLKLLNESFRIASIERHIKRYLKDINFEAKKHLEEIRRP